MVTELTSILRIGHGCSSVVLEKTGTAVLKILLHFSVAQFAITTFYYFNSTVNHFG